MSELEGYDNCENTESLYLALRREAQEVVNILLAAIYDIGDIKEILDIHFANKKIVANKLIRVIRSLTALKA